MEKFVVNNNWGIHWFRRDLRIANNPGLKFNWARTEGRTLGLFCFDSEFLRRPDFSHNRFGFFLNTLKELKNDLQDQGGDLLVMDGLPHETFKRLSTYCRDKNISLPNCITWNRDYEPFALNRDKNIKDLLKNEGIDTFDFRDHLIFEPTEILKDSSSDSYYQIYSPFSRKWYSKLQEPEGQLRIKSQERSKDYYHKKNRRHDLFKLKWPDIFNHNEQSFSDSLQKFLDVNSKNITIKIPKAGFFTAYEKLLNFMSQLDQYKELRDFPYLAGTSQLSIFLKNGSLTSSQIIHSLKLRPDNWRHSSGANQFLKEIVWREFYYSILFHRPEVEKQSFNSKYANLKWENNEEFFNLWKQGLTGFPIIDAGMRQLKQTGWMHNRVRMIVASFLTKDLLIDWRWGENYFMQELLDGDLAPNNGGWQWAASTGCDPQPYFRIFNPWLQSAKFDPEGLYIKKFVPELSQIAAKSLHDPEADRTPWKYPKPIVDHFIQKQKALKLFSQST